MPTLLLAHNTPDSIASAAADRGFTPLLMPPMSDMAPPVASHPDMLLFAGFGHLFVRECHYNNADFKHITKLMSESVSLSLMLTSDAPSQRYPNDIAFNVLHLPNVALIGKADYISGAVGRAATASGLPVIDTHQGYAKCSSAVIGGEHSRDTLAVISADPSICRTVTECGVKAVKIAPGHVTLPGYDTGFIGGASFYHNKTLYFLGNIDRHPDAELIRNTVDVLGISIVSLTDEPLFDAGCLCI